MKPSGPLSELAELIERMGKPNRPEIGEAIAVLRRVARLLGVDLDEYFRGR